MPVFQLGLSDKAAVEEDTSYGAWREEHVFDKFYQVPGGAINTQEKCFRTHLGGSNPLHDPGEVGVPQRGS